LDPEKRSELFQQAQQKFQELKSDPRLQGLKTKAQESLDKLKADPRLQGLKQQAQERFNKFTQRAGKRLSKKKHKNKKWKTQRKLNK